MNADCDVAILGGGLAGLSLALQLRQSLPDARLCVLERNLPPWPAATHKVGESTVEIGANYFGKVIGLEQHLGEQHLRKFGFRFFHSDACEQIDAVQEIGVSRYLNTPSFQIDRGILENHLLECAQAAGVELRVGSKAEAVEFATGDSASDGHRVLLGGPAGRTTLGARWVVDATGRHALLKRQLELAESNGHDVNSVWFRVPFRIDIEDWSQDEQWLGRCERRQRWRSTNHLVGEGYWVWLIPLSSGYHSVGIVADAVRHPFETMNSIERAMEWLGRHQPRLARALREGGAAPSDFGKLRGFSYGCRELFSVNRWAITGEAGLFLDPFYSPGSDFIAMSNTYVADIITRDLGGGTWKPYVDLYGRLFRSFYDSMLSIYRGQYGLFGDPEVLPVKIIWDYAYYWGILSQLHFHRALTDITVFGRTRSSLGTARALNDAMQAYFRAWSRVSRRRNLPRLLDQAALPWFVELNRGLEDRLDQSQLIARIEESLLMLQRLAAEILATVNAEHPGATSWAEAIELAPLLGAATIGPSGMLDYSQGA